MVLSWFPVAALVSRLAVETGSPDALCPDIESTERAIHARLGEIEGEGVERWRVRYTMGHAPESAAGDFVRLELFDPENQRRLSRDLPLAGETCVTMAQAIALVVDRFFRALLEEEAAVREPSPSPAEAAEADAGSAPNDASRERRPNSVLTLEAGAMAPPVLPTLGVAFAGQLSSSFSLTASFTGVLLPATEALEGGGEARVRSALLRLTPARDFALGRARLGVGPSLSLALESGSTTGLERSEVRHRTVVAAGAAASYRFEIADIAAAVSGVVEAPFRPFGGEFVVDGNEVLEPPTIRGFLAIGAGLSWF